MLTVTKLLPRGQGLSPVLLKRAASTVLDWDTRQKSRFDAEDSSGRTLGVFLPRGSIVRGGDVLVAEDGSLIQVIATPQPVMVVRSCPEHGSPFDLVRAAYHLGNRHVALELQPDRLQFEPDPVLAEMLRGLHLIVTEELSSFEPEAGAYGGGHRHADDHGREHGHDDHDHGHAHEHQGHEHDHAHGHAHAHDPAHGHAHAHDHAHDHGHAPHVHGPSCNHDH